MVSAAKNALQKSGRALSEERDKRYRYPVSFDMIAWMRQDMWVGGNLSTRMTYVGSAYGYNFLKRACEYTWDSDTRGEHTLLNKDIVFEFSDGMQKTPGQLGKSDRASHLVCVIAKARSSKTNRGGKTHSEIIADNSDGETQFKKDILTFAKEKRSYEPDEPFFMKFERGRTKKLTREMISQALKQVAREFQLPPEHFSSHCLRSGGATALIHDGKSDQVVRSIGHWVEGSSTAFLYQASTSSTTGSFSVSENRKRLSAKDIHRIHGSGRR